MAAILGFDGSLLKQRHVDASVGYHENLVQLDAGDGALTYPSGGIPVSKEAAGFANYLESIIFVDAGSADGYVAKYDYANQKILLYVEDDNGGPLVELANSATPQVSYIAYSRGY